MDEHKVRFHYVNVPWKDQRDGIIKSQPVMCIAVQVQADRDELIRVGISVRSWSEKTWDRKKMRMIALGRCQSLRISTRTVEYGIHALGLIDAPDVGWNRNVPQVIKFLAPLVGELEYVQRLKRDARLLTLAGVMTLSHYEKTLGGRR